MGSFDGIQTERRTARIAGLWYLLLAAGSGYSWFYMAAAYVEGDAAATTAKILATGSGYLASIAGSVVGQVGFLLLALALYRLFRRTSEPQARLLASFVMVSVPIMFANIVFQAGAYALLTRADFLNVFAASQAKALAMVLVQLHIVGVHIVEVFWGLWLFPFARLAYRSGLFPRILAVLLAVSGGAYVVCSASYLLVPNAFAILERYLSLLEAAGEIPMLVWLLSVGVKACRTGAGGPRVPVGVNELCPGLGEMKRSTRGAGGCS